MMLASAHGFVAAWVWAGGGEAGVEAGAALTCDASAWEHAARTATTAKGKKRKLIPFKSTDMLNVSSHSAQNLLWLRRQTSASADTYVVIHGFAGGWHSWDAVVAHLPTDCGVLAVALPGHDGSAPVSDFEAAIDSLPELPGAHWVGYSAGGRVLLGGLARGLVCDRVTLVSSGMGSLDVADRSARARSDAAWSTLLRTRGVAAFVEAWEAQPLFASQARAPLALREAQRAQRLAADANALADAMDALSVARMPDLSGVLSGVTCPVQLVVGAEDTKYVALARAATHDVARVVELENCGHNPLLEAPRPLAEVLCNFRTPILGSPSH